MSREPFPASLWFGVLYRDRWTCQLCGRTPLRAEDEPCQLSVDHIREIRNGGELLELSNLWTLCRSCHNQKTDDYDDYILTIDPTWYVRIDTEFTEEEKAYIFDYAEHYSRPVVNAQLQNGLTPLNQRIRMAYRQANRLWIRGQPILGATLLLSEGENFPPWNRASVRTRPTKKIPISSRIQKLIAILPTRPILGLDPEDALLDLVNDGILGWDSEKLCLVRVEEEKGLGEAG
jgi:hypothetical protein